MREARRKAWETRRAKYGPSGHGSSYSRGSAAPALNVSGMWTLIIRLHVEGVLSEGQVARSTGAHRVEIRRAADAIQAELDAVAGKARSALLSVSSEPREFQAPSLPLARGGE